jgi:CRP-like cAMP-binding protein
MPALQANRTALVGLQRIEILEGLELPLIEDLAGRLHWHQVRTGERVISREDPDRDVYLVVGGRVQVAAFSSGGKQVTYREIGAGELFGELAHSNSKCDILIEAERGEDVHGCTGTGTFTPLVTAWNRSVIPS